MTDSRDFPTSSNSEGPSSGPNFTSQKRLRPIVWVAAFVLAAVVLVAIALQIFIAERVPDLTLDALEAAESRWQEHGPASYDMDFDIHGAQPGVVHVEVRNGEVVAMSRDGITPKQPRTWVYWSVPGRFEEIEREIELAEDPEHEMNATSGTSVRLRCEFDTELGYPRVFHRMIFGGGPEVYWRVTSFQPQ